MVGNISCMIKPSPARSRNMARIRSSNTQPERALRSLLHGLGFRFRLHRTDLPGRPDMVLPCRKTVVFVHGCFWHRHQNCPRASTPKTNSAFWEAKFQANVARDTRVSATLEAMGWKVLTVWECELADISALETKLLKAIPGKNT